MNLKETLRAFSARTKSADDVMRAIMQYDAWQAPAGYAMDALNTQMFERVAIWGNEPITPTNGQLWLFTDDDAANVFVNTGYHAGPYATGLRGWKLFENIPDTITRVEVNPGSPASEAWQIQNAGFPLTRIWAKAIEVEHFLAEGGAGLVNSILAFPAFTIFTVPNGGIATAVGAGGLKNPGMLFTAPDCADVVQREAGPAAAQLRRANVSGKELFAVFDRLGVDGFVINPRGPGYARLLNEQVCRIIIETAEMEAKAAELEAEAKRLEENS